MFSCYGQKLEMPKKMSFLQGFFTKTVEKGKQECFHFILR